MKKLLICTIIILLVFSGCGVSKGDYESLEKRVRKLEELNGIKSEETKTNKSLTNGKDIYDLSDCSVDEIVEEIDRLLNPNIVNRKPSEFADELGYWAKPQDNNSDFFGGNNSERVTFNAESESITKDQIKQIEYFYGKKMDGSISALNSMRLSFCVCSYDRAVELYNKLLKKYFSDNCINSAYNTQWSVSEEIRRNWWNTMEMNGVSENLYQFYLYLAR